MSDSSQPLKSQSIESAEEWNNRVFSLYVVFLVFAAIVGAWFTIAVFRAGNKVQEAIKADADSRIEALRTEGDKARSELARTNARIGDAEARVAEANKHLEEARRDTAKHEVELIVQRNLLAEAGQRVAEAEAKAAEAKLDLEKFKAPRTVSTEQEAILIERLSRFSGMKLLVEMRAGSEEVERFAKRLSEIFKKAGLIPEVRPAMTFGGSRDGVSARVGSERIQFAEMVAYALQESKVTAGALTVMKSQDAEEFALVIGHK